MSIHVSPTASRFQSRRADAPVSTYSLAGLAAPARRPAPSDLPDEGFSVRLGHMGVVVAIGTASAAAPDFAFGDEAETIRLEVTPDGMGRCAGLLSGHGRDAGTHAADPVVRRLSRALEAAEHEGREFGGLYADALRLAIVTRLLSTPDLADAQTQDAPRADETGRIEAPAETPATAPRRPKSGLPKWRFKRVTAYIEENIGESVTLAGMAAAAGLSRMHFAAQFRVATGMRPHEFLLRRRVERAQQMLLETRDPLVEIALAVGFQTQAHFTTVFRRFVGDTPYQWRCANRARN